MKLLLAIFYSRNRIFFVIGETQVQNFCLKVLKLISICNNFEENKLRQKIFRIILYLKSEYSMKIYLPFSITSECTCIFIHETITVNNPIIDAINFKNHEQFSPTESLSSKITLHLHTRLSFFFFLSLSLFFPFYSRTCTNSIFARKVNSKRFHETYKRPRQLFSLVKSRFFPSRFVISLREIREFSVWPRRRHAQQ